MGSKISFEHWKLQVNAICSRLYGVSADDLPDCPYSDWHEDGLAPLSAAKRAYHNAQEG